MLVLAGRLDHRSVNVIERPSLPRRRPCPAPADRLAADTGSLGHQRAGTRLRRRVRDTRLLELIKQVAERNYGAYGYRRTWLALRRHGVQVGRDRVKRLMRAHGLQGAKRHGKPWRTSIPDPAALRPADLVDRDLTATRPDELWAAD